MTGKRPFAVIMSACLACVVSYPSSSETAARLDVEAPRQLVAGASAQLTVHVVTESAKIDVSSAAEGTRYEVSGAMPESSLLQVGPDGLLTLARQFDGPSRRVTILVANLPYKLTEFVSVELLPAESLVVRADVDVLTVGQTAQLTVSDLSGGLDLTSSASGTKYASTDDVVASVSADGLVQALATRGESQREVRIVAVNGDRSGSVGLTIRSGQAKDGTR